MKKLEGNRYYKIEEYEIGEYEIEYVDGERVENLEYIGVGNVIVYSIKRREDNDYSDIINISNNIRILITDYITMTMIYREIPSNIERIIVDKKEYKNDRYELMEFMEDEDIIEYVMEIENNNKENIYNEKDRKGRNILYYVCNIGREELCIKIAEKMRRESIEGIYDNNNTILHVASYYRMERLINYLIGRVSNEYINKRNKRDETILDLSKKYRLGNINRIMKYINKE